MFTQLHTFSSSPLHFLFFFGFLLILKKALIRKEHRFLKTSSFSRCGYSRADCEVFQTARKASVGFRETWPAQAERTRVTSAFSEPFMLFTCAGSQQCLVSYVSSHCTSCPAVLMHDNSLALSYGRG